MKSLTLFNIDKNIYDHLLIELIIFEILPRDIVHIIKRLYCASSRQFGDYLLADTVITNTMLILPSRRRTVVIN